MVISTYLSIITLNVNGIMPHSVDIAEQNGYKNTRPIYILLITDQFWSKRHTQTESEGMEKDITCK